MASTKQPFPRNLFRGVNQFTGRHRLAEGEVFNLLNFRPDNGKLRVTPRLQQYFTLNNLTDESSQTQIKLIQLVRNLNSQLRYLIINNKTARYVDPASPSTQVQIPVVVQVAKPNNTTVTGEALLYGYNLTDFTATGDNIEVEIQSSTTFRWRRNGGAWNSGLTISGEVALGSNGLKVSFQPSGDGTSYTGYTTGNLWKWQRSWTHPYTGADSSTVRYPFQTDVYNKDIYIAGIERNVMRLRDDFLTSVGYTRVYGKYVCVFHNILFVGQYASGVYDVVNGIRDGYNAASTPFTVGWSHRENPDQFFSSDVNEADQYPFPQQGAHDWSNLGITGMGEQNDQLFVYLPDSVKVGNYVGLPVVMQWRTVTNKIGNLFPSGLVVGVKGHYFIARNDVYCFNGIEFKSIGQKVIEKFQSEIAPITDVRHVDTFGYHDQDTNEIVFTYWMKLGTDFYQARQMIYQEDTGEWYFRNLPSEDSGATDIYCQTRLYAAPNYSIYGGVGEVFRDSRETSGLENDETNLSGAKLTRPFIETLASDYGHKHATKELDNIFVDFDWASQVYLLNVEIAKGDFHAKLGAYASLGNYNPSTPTNGKWITGKKTQGRVLAYKFILGTDGTQPVSDGTLFGYEENIYGIPNQTEK